MRAIDYNQLQALIVVAQERSFTRAAAQLGVTQSALSHSIRALEDKLGIQLLARTTRGVAPTEAGERLLTTITGYYEGIDADIASLGDWKDKPAGTLRLTAHDHAVDTILWPKLRPLLQHYPDIHVEINIHYGLVDIVAERFDAGVRSGEQVALDMIAVRIGPDSRMALVASPGYLATHPAPALPAELTRHRCINLRLPTLGGLYAWELAKEGKSLQVAVQGQLTFNTTQNMLQAALDGFGLAYLPEDLITPYLAQGQLLPVLQDWWPSVEGYHLYYPSRRQPSRAFQLLVDALRYQPS